MADEAHDQPTTPPPWVPKALIGALLVLNVASIIGWVFAASLQKHHPAVLIALNYRNLYLTLVSPRMDAWSFYGIAFVRSVLSDPIFYALGYLYGDRITRWVYSQMGRGGRLIELTEKAFRKARYPMVAFAPNNLVCALAGITRMPVPAFIACNVIGTAVRLVAIRVTGGFFEDQINVVSDFMARYRFVFFGIAAAFVVWSTRSNRGDLADLRQLDKELDPKAK